MSLADYDNSFEHRYNPSGRPPCVIQNRPRTKRCKRCGIEYLGTVSQKYCTPCAPIRKRECEQRNAAKSKAKAQAARAKKEQRQQ